MTAGMSPVWDPRTERYDGAQAWCWDCDWWGKTRIQGDPIHEASQDLDNHMNIYHPEAAE